jgi:hypothetical protein
MIDIVTFGVSGILTITAILISTVLFILTIIFGVIRAIKKKFKKTFITLLIATILFVVIDFFAINNLIHKFSELSINENTEIIQKDGKIILTDNPIEQLFMTDEKITQILCNDIMNKIKTKDYENIKSIFSNDMIKNVTNLDEGINKLIDISNENITNFKVQENGTETHWDSGKHRKTYRFSIDINTDNNVYSIGFEYDYENPFNTETLGVNRMVILDEERNILVLVDNENINKGY